MALFIIIATIILIICSILYFPTIKIKNLSFSSYWPIALIGAFLLLITNSIKLENVISTFTSNDSMNPLKILVLFISMTILSIFLDEVNFFKYLATVVTNHVKGKQIYIFLSLYALTSILTVFTSNDIIILTFTPFICYFARHTKINPIPYLIAEFIAANTWSMMLIIGNPTNIYIATSFGIDFVEYFMKMAIPTIVTGLTTLLLMLIVFHKKLQEPIVLEEEHSSIKNKFLLIVGLLFNMEGDKLQMMVLAGALPPAFSGIIIGNQYQLYERTGTSSLAFSILLFVLAAPFWIWITHLVS